jgi:hypothetical protein
MRYKFVFTLMFLLAVSTAAWAQPVRPMQGLDGRGNPECTGPQMHLTPFGGIPCGNGLSKNYQIPVLPKFGFQLVSFIPDVLEAQFTTPEAANSPLPAKGEATPQQMAGYWDEAHKLPKGEFLRKLVDPDQIPSSVGLAIVNGEYVWVVTIDSGPIRPAFEARVRAEFAKFTDKKVVFGVQKRADIHDGNSSGAWLPPPETN